MRNWAPSYEMEAAETMKQGIGRRGDQLRAVERALPSRSRAPRQIHRARFYGVLAYTVAQRTREIGLRMALGAGPARVRGMVLRQVGIMTLVGGIIGLAGALGVGRAAQPMLYQMTGADPAVLALSALVPVLVAVCAGAIPAYRASRLDPMRALRWE